MPTAEERARLFTVGADIEALCRTLRTDVTTAGDAAFKVAIMDAFAQYGDARRVLPDVERLASVPATTDLHRDVSDAARDCAAAVSIR